MSTSARRMTTGIRWLAWPAAVTEVLRVSHEDVGFLRKRQAAGCAAAVQGGRDVRGERLYQLRCGIPA